MIYFLCFFPGFLIVLIGIFCCFKTHKRYTEQQRLDRLVRSRSKFDLQSKVFQKSSPSTALNCFRILTIHIIVSIELKNFYLKII
jgi:hypothetical protein